ncbi:MAG: c-type cytochrome [Comamonas sp.]
MSMPYEKQPQSAWHFTEFVEISLVLTVGAVVLFVGVMVLLALSLRTLEHQQLRSKLWLLGGGLALPVVVLTALFFYSEARRALWKPLPPANALIVSVIGHMWWWEVHYDDPHTGLKFSTANEIRLPVGRPTYFALSSADVIHSFWVPALGGKMDMLPGKIQHLLVSPDKLGNWRGQCAEFCGEQHARMALDVMTLHEAAFQNWAQAQAQPALTHDAVLNHPGQRAFLRARCQFCHTVRGVTDVIGSDHTEAGQGPDLTHLASRRSIGASTLPNNQAQLLAWIRQPHANKPGVQMPAGAMRLSDSELEDIATWLSLLK